MHSQQFLRQLHTPAYTGQRPLDLALFANDPGLPAGRAAALDAWLPWAPLAEVQRALQAGQVTSRELALYFTRRIQRYAALNAVGELNPAALEAAESLDAERRAGQVRGPLHGIPLLLKDNITTGDGMHTTAGAKVLEGLRASADSGVAERLRAAGALLLGKANLSEWANAMTSQSANGFSALGGQVRSPYGRFDVSGSSSGSAAAVAAGLIPAAIGTETCGSLISPGSANSLAVLKPSLGLVSRRWIIPITGVTDTAGPMARGVADLAVLMAAMAGPDPADAVTLQAPRIDWTAPADAGALRGLRLGFVSTHKPRGAQLEMVAACERGLRSCGAEVVHLKPRAASPWADILKVLRYGMRHDVQAYLQGVPGGAPVGSLAEVVAFNQADLPNRAPFGQDLLEAALAQDLTPAEHAALAEHIRAVTGGELRRLRTEAGVHLLVSLGSDLAGYFAIAGFPALIVPAGYRKAGKPFGLTFVGEPFEDGRLLAAAYAFEQATHSRLPPRRLDV